MSISEEQIKLWRENLIDDPDKILSECQDFILKSEKEEKTKLLVLISIAFLLKNDLDEYHHHFKEAADLSIKGKNIDKCINYVNDCARDLTIRKLYEQAEIVYSSVFECTQEHNLTRYFVNINYNMGIINLSSR